MKAIAQKTVRLIFFSVALLSVSACASSKESDTPSVKGDRISVLSNRKSLLGVEGEGKSFDFSLALPQTNKNWALVGGNPSHNLTNSALNKSIDEAWDVSVGDGSDNDFRLLASPVVYDGSIFTIDARGQVCAFDIEEGERLWCEDTTREDADGEAMPGGIGVGSDSLFATTGFGDLISLSLLDGSVRWRASVNKPIRSAPTIADGRVYIVTLDNELHVFDERVGKELWKHSAGGQSATLMGASSPAVFGDNVVVAYTTGDIFNLRAQTGRMAWGDSLASSKQMGALPAIADIRGLPVIDRGRVFAISHSGRMAAIDLRTGERAWDKAVGGTNTPLVAGDAVYVVSNDNQFLALSRVDGHVVWSIELARHEDPEDRDSASIFWTGPVMAGGLLWLGNTQGQLIAYSAMTGEQRFDFDLGAPLFISPIVAANTLFAVTDEGRLFAIR